MTSLMQTASSPPARPTTLGRRWMWAWPVAALLGFPIGGYVANLTVGAVDSVGAALAGGLIAGADCRHRAVARPEAVRCMALDPSATSLGPGCRPRRRCRGCRLQRRSSPANADGSDLRARCRGAPGARPGRHGFAGALWWAAVNPPAWALAWLVSSYVISANIDERFTNFGASGVLLYALVTGLLLAWMFRRTESQAPSV